MFNERDTGVIVWNNYEAMWVAVFILLLLWWIAFAFAALRKSDSSSDDGMLFSHRDTAADTSATPGGHSTDSDASTRNRRHNRISAHFREGLILLLTSAAITFALGAPHSAANALAWVFTGTWIFLGACLLFDKWPRIFHVMQFLAITLVVAIISNAFANSLPITTST